MINTWLAVGLIILELYSVFTLVFKGSLMSSKVQQEAAGEHKHPPRQLALWALCTFKGTVEYLPYIHVHIVHM